MKRKVNQLRIKIHVVINFITINILYLFKYVFFCFRYTTLAKMVDTDTGNLFIVGSFDKRTDPDFKVSIHTNVVT